MPSDSGLVSGWLLLRQREWRDDQQTGKTALEHLMGGSDTSEGSNGRRTSGGYGDYID